MTTVKKVDGVEYTKILNPKLNNTYYILSNDAMHNAKFERNESDDTMGLQQFPVFIETGTKKRVRGDAYLKSDDTRVTKDTSSDYKEVFSFGIAPSEYIEGVQKINLSESYWAVTDVDEMGHNVYTEGKLSVEYTNDRDGEYFTKVSIGDKYIIQNKSTSKYHIYVKKEPTETSGGKRSTIRYKRKSRRNPKKRKTRRNKCRRP